MGVTDVTKRDVAYTHPRDMRSLNTFADHVINLPMIPVHYLRIYRTVYILLTMNILLLERGHCVSINKFVCKWRPGVPGRRCITMVQKRSNLKHNIAHRIYICANHGQGARVVVSCTWMIAAQA